MWDAASGRAGDSSSGNPRGSHFPYCQMAGAQGFAQNAQDLPVMVACSTAVDPEEALHNLGENFCIKCYRRLTANLRPEVIAAGFEVPTIA